MRLNHRRRPSRVWQRGQGFSRTEGKEGEAAEDGGHQALAGDCRMRVRARATWRPRTRGRSGGRARGVGAEEDVAVGEEQPGGRGLTGGESHGVGLAHPAVREGVDVEDGEGFAGRVGFGGDAVDDGAGCVGGAVVDGDDVDGDGLDEEGAEGGFDAGGFVAGGDDDGDFGVAGLGAGSRGGS